MITDVERAEVCCGYWWLGSRCCLCGKSWRAGKQLGLLLLDVSELLLEDELLVLSVQVV